MAVIRTRDYIFGTPRRKFPHEIHDMKTVGKLLFSECATGARLFYGVIQCLVGLSALLAAYR